MDSSQPISAATTTRDVLSTSVAGPDNTAPVHTVNWEPCHGQATVDPSSLPSLNGPCLCVHLDCVAQNLPATLNTETLPIRSAAPGGTASTRNSFSLRFRDCEEESATLACCALICICCFSLVDRSLGALVLHRLYDRPTSPVVTVCLIVKIGGQLSQIRDVTGH